MERGGTALMGISITCGTLVTESITQCLHLHTKLIDDCRRVFLLSWVECCNKIFLADIICVFSYQCLCRITTLAPFRKLIQICD